MSWAALLRYGRFPDVNPPGGPSEWGLAALKVARRELGRGEEGGNNIGPDLDRYRRGGPGGPWCAALGSYEIEEGWEALCIARGMVTLPRCPVRRSHSAKTLFANVLAAGGIKLARPELGALVLWHRGVAGARTGHWGICCGVAELDDGLWQAIEGNKGGYPSRVREYPHELGEPLLLGFVRLP